MTTSRYGFLLAGSPEAAADEPVSTDEISDTLNNIAHLVDECSQVRVCFPPRTGITYTSVAHTETSTYQLVAAFGPFQLAQKSSGTPYKLRVSIAGFSSAGDSISLRAVVSTLGTARSDMETAGANTETFTTTGTSAAWLSPGSDNLITLDNEQFTRSKTVINTEEPDGSPVSVGITRLFLTVWSSTSNLDSTPTLSGAYLAEYVGT